MKKSLSLLTALAIQLLLTSTFAQKVKFTKHENVIYGMISGMALLMDVYQPANSNHLGIIFINGSAWGYWDYYQKVYNQHPLKNDYTGDAYAGPIAQSLVEKGYTVFFINHRFAPRFHFPDIFYDCQRAVRFIRYNAKTYEIDPKHIGTIGHSSGANLSAMLGVVDTIIVKPESGIDSMSSKVQSVITLAAHFDLSDMNRNEDTAMIRNTVLKATLNYMGELPEEKDNQFVLSGKYAMASPITHVTSDDAAFLIYYSDNDPIVPARHAPRMFQKLKDNSVPVKMVKRTNQGHTPKPDMDEVDNWLKQYLK